MSQPLLQVSHLSKSVSDATGTLDILCDIDFAVQARETLAIVGSSGSGKSTLLSIMAGLDVPTQGTVELLGQDLFALDEDGRAQVRGRNMGFVFQSFQLLAHLTALENVMLPLELAGRPQARALATEMLHRVGLGERLRHFPRVLSGGEQQRVALARAFVMKPPLLLADEPTGSLDPATGERVMDLMLQLNAEQGTTLILVTHDPALAARCARTLRLEAGRLVWPPKVIQGRPSPTMGLWPLPPSFYSDFTPSACASKPHRDQSKKSTSKRPGATPACASSWSARAKRACA